VSERRLKENPDGLALRARPQSVTRLNRRSLLVLVGGAAVVGLGACLWAFRARGPVAPGSANELRSPPSVTRAEGLDRLPRDYDGWRPIPKLGPPNGELGRPVLREERNAGFDPEPSSFRPNPEEDAERVARLRLQEESQAAAKAQVFFRISHTRDESSPATAAEPMAASGDRAASEPPASPPGGSTEESTDRDQRHKQGFVDKNSDPPIYAAGLLQKTRSPYELMAGTVIAAALVTGINSDLPGQTIATVTQNVYDTVTGNYLLIPQGSRVLGQYDAQVAYGQRRVLLVWTRLIMPDGSSITLDRLQGVDTSGYAGLEDRVDSHWGRLLAGAAVSTLLGVNAQLATQDQGVNSGSLTIALRQSSQDSINQVGQQITRKNLNVQPTLTVRPGFPLRIIVNKDLILRPYTDARPLEPAS
jgi:type IV secretion system protein VirB10